MIRYTYPMAVAVLTLAIMITGMVWRHLYEQGWRVHAEFSVRRIGRGSWPIGVTASADHWTDAELPYLSEESYQLSGTLYLLWYNVAASIELIKP